MYGTHGEYPYFLCGKCGCLQIREAVDDIAKYYNTDHYYSFNMNKRKLKNELLFLQMKDQVEKKDLLGKLVGYLYPVNYAFFRLINKEDYILDVGCGDGELLRWLKRLGYQNVMGIDPYVGQDIIVEDQILVAKGDVREYDFKDTYKMITLIHSLEHVYQQQEQIAALDAHLERGGFLVFQLPVLSQYYWKQYGTRLYTLDPPRHFYLHTKKSLQELMKPFPYKMIDYATEIDVAIPEMARNIERGNTEKNGGTGFITGTISALRSRKLKKQLKKEEDGAIATVVFQKMQ
ncbi:MAG: class I SAM-dependent methyltransferase [Lachnospiraceae bacterium]|nr:class I SAM-dependent methyltransferase [Lachnospiraceae bacterium]